MKSAVLALLLLVAAAAPALALAGTCDFTQRSSIGTPFVNETKVTDASRLPVSRPPLWNFRTLENVTWACTRTGLNGWTLIIKHNPIPGVSKAAFKWLWDNMAGNAVSDRGRGARQIVRRLSAPRAPSMRAQAAPQRRTE
jgi:hypothetical protein